MKKYTIVVLFMLVGFSAQGMQKMSRCAQAGLLAGHAVQQTRSKVSLATLAHVHKSLPRASFKFSPLLGAANALNGTLSRELKESKLAQSFFNQLPEEPIRYTVADGNPAKYLIPHLLGELLALHSSGELYKKEFFKSAMFCSWAAQYKGPEDAKGFAAQVRKLLNRMQKESDAEKVREMLLTAVYFQADTADDVKTFLQASKNVVAESDETLENKKLMADYADTFFALTAAKKDMSFLQAEEIREMAGFCSEKALWSVLNMIFYNPERAMLDLAMVPEELQKTCLPEFASFVSTYSNPTLPKFYQSAHKDFLKLVHGIEGVRYLRGTVEVPGERSETLKILNHLLGTRASTYQELAQKLSVAEKRTVSFYEPEDKDYGSIKVTVNDQKAAFSGTWKFGRGHVAFVFDKQDKDTSTQEVFRKIEKVEAAVNSGGVLVRLVPGWLHRSIEWGLGNGVNESVSDVEEILKKNKVTKAELNELSQGLREKKCTILHTAIEQKRADLVSCFLEQGADPNKADSNGDSPLWLAIRKGDTAMVQAFVSAGVLINEKNNNGDTALMIASYRGHTEVVKLLMSAGGALINEKDYYDGKTALMIASCKGHTEVVKLLMSAGGALINEKDYYDGKTALMIASYEGHTEVVKLLMSAGALINEKNNDGKTALMIASYEGHTEVVKLLMSAGALVNEKNNHGRTALMIATCQGHTEVVKLLKEAELAQRGPSLSFMQRARIAVLVLKNRLF